MGKINNQLYRTKLMLGQAFVEGYDTDDLKGKQYVEAIMHRDSVLERIMLSEPPKEQKNNGYFNDILSGLMSAL